MMRKASSPSPPAQIVASQPRWVGASPAPARRSSTSTAPTPTQVSLQPCMAEIQRAPCLLHLPAPLHPQAWSRTCCLATTAPACLATAT
jgi:hypothetical protein